MKEFTTLFKTSVEGTFDEFSALFVRELKLLLGPTSRFEEIEDRQLDGICREVADPESISVLLSDEEGKTNDLMLLPLRIAAGRMRYVVAEGSLRHVDLDHLHLFKWLYETRLDSDIRVERFRANAVYDCDTGVLSGNLVPLLFDMEKARAVEFGASMGLLILRFRHETLSEALEMTRKHMRRTDYLFGLAPGEFLLMLVECSAHGSEAILQRLKKMLGSRILSSGYSIYPEQGETADHLIAKAQGSLV